MRFEDDAVVDVRRQAAPAPDARGVAHAFRLPEPTGPLVPLRYGSSETWRLDTRRDPYFVKRLVVGEWRDQLERAMSFERRAAEAGLPVSVPVEPVTPAFGLAADLGDGHGVVRVHAWLDAEPCGNGLSRWFGATLADLHVLRAADDGPSTPSGGCGTASIRPMRGTVGWPRDTQATGRGLLPSAATAD
ncbi:phosphotransferase [Streptomyces odontomachi]|uniref:phosphotransferase n=1 Tax=Streptomyces odontomachi TaxID=2944940 RepID=UPI0035A84263